MTVYKLPGLISLALTAIFILSQGLISNANPIAPASSDSPNQSLIRSPLASQPPLHKSTHLTSAKLRVKSTKPELDKSSLLKQASLALHHVAQKATPAVVSITAVKSLDSLSDDLMPTSEALEPSSLGIGSGVIIKANGYILTNYHVIESADRITVWLDDEKKFQAQVVGVDPNTDLAVIKINPAQQHSLPYLSFGDSDQLRVGEWIITIGSPYGLVHSVTSGIISALGRAQLGVLDFENFIQTDAAINPGNSGGPLLNTQGEIIGINTAIFSQNGGFSGIGFAIPSNTAKKVMMDILQNGRVIRGWAGITAQDLNEELAQYFHLPKNQGALLSDIKVGSPAHEAHLKKGDVITSYQGKEVHSAMELKTYVTSSPLHSPIRLEGIRGGKKLTAQLSIIESPHSPLKIQKEKKKNKKSTPPSMAQRLGIQVRDLSPEIAELLKISHTIGVLVSQVRVGGLGFEAGLMNGDLILSANETEIHSTKEFHSFLKTHTNEQVLILYVQRGPSEKLFIPIKTET
jgi:serine protease Do